MVEVAWTLVSPVLKSRNFHIFFVKSITDIFVQMNVRNTKTFALVIVKTYQDRTGVLVLKVTLCPKMKGLVRTLMNAKLNLHAADLIKNVLILAEVLNVSIRLVPRITNLTLVKVPKDANCEADEVDLA